VTGSKNRKGSILINLLIILLLIIGICLGLLGALGYITSHGKYANVPEVTGMTLDEATELLDKSGFRVEIQDSVWMADMKPTAIVKQTPEGKAVVKANRKVFLTVNRIQPPLIEMPSLVGLTFRNANIWLKQMGLELGDTARKPDIAKDAVLEQLYNGRPIAPGTRIFVGTKISFVLGSGLGEMDLEVPDLYGMRFAEAKRYLQDAGLNVGAVVPDFDVTDTASAFIYKQNPEKKEKDADGRTIINKIRVGQAIDLFLSKAVPTGRVEENDPESVSKGTNKEDEEE